ncbi:MAG: septum formation protein Maf [Ignavibacteriae bacterium]|nr:septum formation protein Maf [Ignavibacteriota bacterium]
MIKSRYPIYLASNSPRRKDMLKMLGVEFKTISVDLDEIFKNNESPVNTVKRLALEKLELAAQKVNDGIIITADTIVVIDNHRIGKPKNKKDAENILTSLSGRSHFVYTGFSIYNLNRKKQVTDYSKTKVTFRDLTKAEIKEYIQSGSPMDKAGAYGIQDDYGSVFVEKISGCYYNVLGFPASKIYSTLKLLS